MADSFKEQLEITGLYLSVKTKGKTEEFPAIGLVLNYAIGGFITGNIQLAAYKYKDNKREVSKKVGENIHIVDISTGRVEVFDSIAVGSQVSVFIKIKDVKETTYKLFDGFITSIQAAQMMGADVFSNSYVFGLASPLSRLDSVPLGSLYTTDKAADLSKTSKSFVRPSLNIAVENANVGKYIKNGLLDIASFTASILDSNAGVKGEGIYSKRKIMPILNKNTPKLKITTGNHVAGAITTDIARRYAVQSPVSVFQSILKESFLTIAPTVSTNSTKFDDVCIKVIPDFPWGKNTSVSFAKEDIISIGLGYTNDYDKEFGGVAVQWVGIDKNGVGQNVADAQRCWICGEFLDDNGKPVRVDGCYELNTTTASGAEVISVRKKSGEIAPLSSQQLKIQYLPFFLEKLALDTWDDSANKYTDSLQKLAAITASCYYATINRSGSKIMLGVPLTKGLSLLKDGVGAIASVPAVVTPSKMYGRIGSIGIRITMDEQFSCRCDIVMTHVRNEEENKTLSVENELYK